MTPFRYLIAGLIACLIQGYALSFAPQDKVLNVSMNQSSQGMKIQLMASAAPTPVAEPQTTIPVQAPKRPSEEKPLPPTKKSRNELLTPERMITKSNASIEQPQQTQKVTKAAKPRPKAKTEEKTTAPKKREKGNQKPKERQLVKAPEKEIEPTEQRKKVNSETANNVESATSSNQSSQPMLVKKPRFTAKPTPVEYPHLARKKGLEGRTLIEVWLDENGKQIKQKIIQSSGHEILDTRALNTIKQWQFSRQMSQGEAIAHRVQIPINFKLK